MQMNLLDFYDAVERTRSEAGGVPLTFIAKHSRSFSMKTSARHYQLYSFIHHDQRSTAHKEILQLLPVLGATSEQLDPTARVKFFYPDFSWTWYGIEFDGEDCFWGFVIGFEREFGNFMLSELMENRGKLGLPIERDLWFEPTPISKLP